MTGSQPAASHTRRRWRRLSLMSVAVGLGVTATTSAQVTTKGGGPIAPVPMSTAGLSAFFKPKPGAPLAATKVWAYPPLVRPAGEPFDPTKKGAPIQLAAVPVAPMPAAAPPKAVVPTIDPTKTAAAPLKPAEPPKPVAIPPVAVKPTTITPPAATPVTPPPATPPVVVAKAPSPPPAMPPVVVAKASSAPPTTASLSATPTSAVTPPTTPKTTSPVVAAGNNEPVKPTAPPTVSWPEPALAQKVIGGQTPPQPSVKLPDPGPLAAPPKGDLGMKVALQPVPMTQPAPLPMGGGVERARQVQPAQPPAGPAAPGVGAPGGVAAGQPGAAGQAVEQLGPPRPLDDKPRLSRMGNGPLGTTPVPTEKDLAKFRKFVSDVIDPQNTLDVVEGRARLILLKKEPTQYQLVDPTLVAANQLADPKQFSVLGRRVGTTVLNLWFADPTPDDPQNETILSYLVRVIPDPETKARLERVYRALEDEINRYFPNSRVRLTLVGDKLMVSGQAHDIYDATQILRILRANAPTTGATRPPVNTVGASTGNPLDPTNPTGTPGQESFILEGGPNVINNLRIPGEQQVMLRVTVAEVNRAAARSIGVNFNIINNQGITVFGQTTGGVFGAGNLITNLDNGQIPVAINALRTLNYARSLAEPNITALNGQTATFLAGGQFPVPVLGGVGQLGGLGGGGLQGVQFVPFGVQLSFTPFITDRDRVRLNLQATVSTRDNNAGANIGGAAVPGLNARTFTTTVEMREGQTMAVAGLIQNNLGADATRVPFFGDLPYVGRLLGLERITSGEQELVVLVTPELVHPLNQNELTPLPGSDIYEPGDLEFYLKGRLESRRSYDYRSAVRTDIDRMLSYRRCEQQFITGPTGHVEGVFNRPLTAPTAGK